MQSSVHHGEATFLNAECGSGTSNDLSRIMRVKMQLRLSHASSIQWRQRSDLMTNVVRITCHQQDLHRKMDNFTDLIGKSAPWLQADVHVQAQGLQRVCSRKSRGLHRLAKI